MASVTELGDERRSKRFSSNVETSRSHDLGKPDQKRARFEQDNTPNSDNNKNDEHDDRYKSLSQAAMHAEVLSRLSCGARHLLSKLPMPSFGTLYEDSKVQPLDRAKCPNCGPTKVYVESAGCIDTAKILHRLFNPESPTDTGVCVLNIANGRSPGATLSTSPTMRIESSYDRRLLFKQEIMTITEANFYMESAPLEEQLCYRTSLALTLNPGYYPLSDANCIFSPAVSIYRHNRVTGCALADTSEGETLSTISCISIPAVDPLCFGHHVLRSFRRQKFGDLYYGSPSDRAWMKSKMRSVLRIAAMNGQRRIVLTAFGCGGFANPTLMVARLWRMVLSEAEFNGWFRSITFAGLISGRRSPDSFRLFRMVMHGLVV